MTLTYGSLFSGIGGIDLGLDRAGMVCKWQVEIDPFCQRVLAKHWPYVRRYADVRCTTGRTGKGWSRYNYLEPVDLICGGFPCQPHSVAGKRRGASDNRNLWPEYLRLIRELQPTWVFGENVPGIQTTILDQVLSDLEGANYQTRVLSIPACAFDAPHIRERIWILAHSNGIRRTRQETRKPTYNSQRDHSAHQQRGSAKFYAPLAGSETYSNTGRQRLPQRHEQGNVATQTIGIIARGEPERMDAAGRWEQWQVEPGVGRVADGVPDRVDRLRSLGNAVVPQVAEWIGRRILEAA